MAQRDLSTFGLSCTGVLVRPDLDVVRETLALCIEIVNEYHFLAGVAVKPLVLRLNVGGVWV